MEYRQLGRSGLRVSALGFGTATFGGLGGLAKWGSTDAAQAERLLDVCLEAGVNLIDTANAYSRGRSEEILGQAMAGRRERLLVATKVRFGMGDGPNDMGLSRHHVIAQCEASLRRLGTDRIDLYQMHQWDGLTPLEETLEAFDTLTRAGKIRYYGVSNFAGWQLMKTMGAARAGGLIPPVAQQIYYSLESRDAEFELIPAGLDQGLGALIWSPLAGGLLSGKYRRGTTPESGRHLNDWHEPPVSDEARLYDTVEALVEIGAAREVSPAAVALAWLLGRRGVTAAILGARTEDQLRSNLIAAEVRLADDERARLDRVSLPRLPYPHWHQLGSITDRLGVAEASLLGDHIAAADAAQG